MEHGERGDRRFRALLWVLPALTLLYGLSSIVVFDFSSAAVDANGAPESTAHGPEPRLWICRPARYHAIGGAEWDGSEWPFRFYRPICRMWLLLNGTRPVPR